MIEVNAPFPRGNCPIHSFGPEDTSAPVILFFPDAFGPRKAAFDVAEELAGEGWRVLMMDPFYEFIPYERFGPVAFNEEGPARDRLMAMFGAITPDKIDADARAMLALAEKQSEPGVPFAATGYCMGGRYVLSAACASARVKFAAAWHAAALAPAEGDSPHRRLGDAKGRIYIGTAGIDPMYDAAEHGRLAEALRAADTDHVIENYRGAAHGWVFPDIPIYDEAAARKHMRRMKEHCAEMFAR